MDRNGDGKINDGTELFGVATLKADGTRAGNGYEAMKIEDSNQDGKLTSADARYSELKLWVDANQDGKTDDGELRGLADFGIVSLDLSALTGSEVDNGNLLGLTSSYTTADGAHARHGRRVVRQGRGGGTGAQRAAGRRTGRGLAGGSVDRRATAPRRRTRPAPVRCPSTATSCRPTTRTCR